MTIRHLALAAVLALAPSCTLEATAQAGVTVSNVGFGRYGEPSGVLVGMWWGKGSTGDHHSISFGAIGSTGATARYDALVDAAKTSSTAFEDAMTSAESTWYSAQPAAAQAGIYTMAHEAGVNGWCP